MSLASLRHLLSPGLLRALKATGDPRRRACVSQAEAWLQEAVLPPAQAQGADELDLAGQGLLEPLQMGPCRGEPVHHDKCHSKINSV